MRTSIFLAVMVALATALPGAATAGERGWRQHHGWHQGHRDLGPRHHGGKHFGHGRFGGQKFAHGRSWKRHGHRHFGHRKFGHHRAWKPRRHHDRLKSFGLFHGKGFVIARDRFGSSFKVIIGPRHRHFPKWRHRFRH